MTRTREAVSPVTGSALGDVASNAAKAATKDGITCHVFKNVVFTCPFPFPANRDTGELAKDSISGSV